jgi:hypothetical protein
MNFDIVLATFLIIDTIQYNTYIVKYHEIKMYMSVLVGKRKDLLHKGKVVKVHEILPLTGFARPINFLPDLLFLLEIF